MGTKRELLVLHFQNSICYIYFLKNLFLYAQFELFANPIYSEEGDFPELVKTIVAENSKEEGRKRSRLPQFTQEEIKLITGKFFFHSHHTMNILCAGNKNIGLSILRGKAGICRNNSILAS